MKIYDRLGQIWLPYLMYFHTPSFTSSVVNTDSRGFRHVYKGGVKISDFEIGDFSSVSLLVGSSCAFGIGASSDRQTIPSLLNEITGSLWLNFGGRAFNSTQELLLFQLYHQRLKNIKKVIILSGLNNIMLHFISRAYFEEFGSFYFSNQFNQAMNRAYRSIKCYIPQALLRVFLKKSAIPADKRYMQKEDIFIAYQRDIALWKLLSDKLGIELCFVLQPFAKWVDKKASAEEENLFKDLDRSRKNTLRAAKHLINRDLYEWFVKHLAEICASYGVPFFDMNSGISKRRLDGRWLFIDRSHLTDEGYRVAADILKEMCLLK